MIHLKFSAYKNLNCIIFSLPIIPSKSSFSLPSRSQVAGTGGVAGQETPEGIGEAAIIR